MIGNVTQGSGFSGLLQYLYTGHKDKPNPDRVAWTGFHRLMPTDDPERLAGILRSTADLYPREVGKPVIHISLSWAPGEEPTEAKMRQVAGQVLERMELGRHQAVLVAHRDTDHRHVHIAANQVSEDGERLWNAWKSKTRLEATLRELEREHGFEVVPGRLAPVPGREKPARALLTRQEYAQALKANVARSSPEQMLHVRQELRRRFRSSRSWAELHFKLDMAGLRLERRGRGLVVTDGKRSLKASRIDRQGSKRKLEERFGQTYESWIAQRRQIWKASHRVSHYKKRRSRLEYHYGHATAPEVAGRIRRILGRMDSTIQGLEGDLRAVYRPLHAHVVRSLPKREGHSRQLRALNLISGLLPYPARTAFRTAIQAMEFFRELGRERSL